MLNDVGIGFHSEGYIAGLACSAGFFLVSKSRASVSISHRLGCAKSWTLF